MPTLQQIGSFKLTSPTLVVTDPGYDEGTLHICDCQIGDWCVELTLDSTPEWRGEVPRLVIAVCEGFSRPIEPTDWQRTGETVGGDGGILGIYDLAHFHDHGLVPSHQSWTFDGGPAAPDDLWYSLNCEAIRGRLAALIPHGVVVRWDGGMNVDSLASDNRIIGVRMSISGWPDRI
jgi:hypothetical protein